MKTEIDPQTGELKIDIAELLAQLDDEVKLEIAKSHTWESVMYREIKDAVLNGYASANYNSDIYNLRVAFLTGEGADRRIREAVRDILEEVKQARSDCSRWQEAFWKIYHAWPEDLAGRCPVDYLKYTDAKNVTDAELDEALK